MPGGFSMKVLARTTLTICGGWSQIRWFLRDRGEVGFYISEAVELAADRV